MGTDETINGRRVEEVDHWLHTVFSSSPGGVLQSFRLVTDFIWLALKSSLVASWLLEQKAVNVEADKTMDIV